MKLLRTLAPLIAVASTITAVPASAGTTTITTTVRIAAPPRAIYGMGPIAHIAPRLRAVFTCIIARESRSTWAHPNLADVSKTGSSGIFQFENGPNQVWSRWAPTVGVRVPVWKATILQQEQVAVAVYRHDGFAPWTDGCA